MGEETVGRPKVHLTRLFTFEAAHRLPLHTGRCRNMHGHSWKAEVTILGPINPATGMVFDFADFKRIGNSLFDGAWDHASLLYREDPVANALLTVLPQSRIVLLDQYPTSEYLSQLAFEHFEKYLPVESGITVERVRLWETANCCADAIYWRR